MNHLISTTEASAILGVSPSRVRALVRTCRLPTIQIAGRNLINPRDLKQLRSRVGAGVGGGRMPQKKQSKKKAF